MELSEKSTNHYKPTSAWAPKAKAKKGGLGNFIWNSDTNEFMGRNGMSWCKITLFYLIFFSGLALFFMSSLMVFLATLEDNRPRWTLEESLIGSNPGVGFRPMPDQDLNTDSSLIWIKREEQEKYWTKELNNYLAGYKNPNYTQSCSFDYRPADENIACQVPVDDLKVCNNLNGGFGYGVGTKHKTQPCVLVKLNKIYGWVPEPYNTMERLEEAKKRGMPADLLKRIEGLIQTGDKNRLNTVWISCEGENPADIENIGERRYYAPGIPGEFPGIPAYYFPYLMQEEHVSPFVFVQFANLGLYTLINVRCNAWAYNIKADTLNRAGLVHFEFLID